MVKNAKLVELLDKIGDKIIEEKEYLTNLDAPIGDSDHGINMAKGFYEVKKRLFDMRTQDIGTILKSTGMTLVATVGGSSGPLYGTAFMKMGMAVGNKKELTFPEFLEAYKLGIEGIKRRGRSTTGEKTMLDAMVPALEAMEKEFLETGDGKKAFQAGAKASWEGVEHTKDLIATKGRASYVGERGIGHQDPGATSFSYMIQVVADSL